jgi:hypothetical protein
LPLGLAVAGAGCLNPEDAYDSFVSRAEDAQPPPQPVNEAGMVDVAALRAPDASFDDTSFVMICLSQVSEVVSQALLWKVTLKFNVADGGGGTLTYSSTSLAAGANNISDTLPNADLGPYTVPVNELGVANVDIAEAVLPQAANAITGTQLTLQDIVISMHIESPTQICASLGANVTAPPPPLTLDPAQNPCIYLPTDSQGHWATVTTDDLHCP